MKESFSLKVPEYLQIESWHSEENLVAGFTTKHGGVSEGVYSSLNCGLHVGDKAEDVIRNRKRLAELLKLPLKNWVIGEQVHANKVAFVGQSESGLGADSLDSAIAGVDGLVTNEKNILLAAFFADCFPLFFYDAKQGIIGLAHAGWKGTVNQIASEVVKVMQDAGSQLETIQVTIGPGISQSFYEVDERVFQAVDVKWQEKVFTKRENGRFLLDLKSLNKEILLQNGILRHNISMTNYCTYKDEALFFSHRRDQGKTGRMLGFIGMRTKQ